MEQSTHNKNGGGPEVSIILPCRNEELAMERCLDEIVRIIAAGGIKAEIIVVDNASSDGSADIVKKVLDREPTVKLLREEVVGYGSACLRGIASARGAYIFIADADGTYDFKEIPNFISKLKEGNDLVVGNRFLGGMKENAMPWHHRHVGNPLLSLLVRLFFHVKISDIHCGMRAISKTAFEKIVLYTSGMEFASEMVIKVAKQNMEIAEVPIEYWPRVGESKLRSFRDGWRHLRFILLYSPLVLFLLPGLFLFAIGLISLAFFYFSRLYVFGVYLYVHPMFLSALCILTGYQLMLFAGFAKTYAITHLGDKNEFISKLFGYVSIEKAGIAGILAALVGGGIYLLIFIKWITSGLGSLDETKNSIVALTLIAVGIQTFFSAFMLSTVGIKEK